MERALTEWEAAVVTRLASLDAVGADVVRESVPHLVVTGGCGCGCPSFDLRDVRYPRQPHHLSHFADGWTPDRQIGFVLFLDPAGARSVST